MTGKKIGGWRYRRTLIILFTFIIICSHLQAFAFIDERRVSEIIFYVGQLRDAKPEVLITIIKDKEEDAYRRAAAVRVITAQVLAGPLTIGSKELEEELSKVFVRASNSLLKIEIASSLVAVSRSRWFAEMVPYLIRRLDFDNYTINEQAYEAISQILGLGRQSSAQAPLGGRERKEEALIVRRAVQKTSRNTAAMSKDLSEKKRAQKARLLEWADSCLRQ